MAISTNWLVDNRVLYEVIEGSVMPEMLEAVIDETLIQLDKLEKGTSAYCIIHVMPDTKVSGGMGRTTQLALRSLQRDEWSETYIVGEYDVFLRLMGQAILRLVGGNKIHQVKSVEEAVTAIMAADEGLAGLDEALKPLVR